METTATSFYFQFVRRWQIWKRPSTLIPTVRRPGMSDLAPAALTARRGCMDKQTRPAHSCSPGDSLGLKGALAAPGSQCQHAAVAPGQPTQPSLSPAIRYSLGSTTGPLRWALASQFKLCETIQTNSSTTHSIIFKMLMISNHNFHASKEASWLL